MDIKKWIGVISLTATFFLTSCSGEPEWKGVYDTCKDQVKQGMSDLQTSTNNQSIKDMAQSAGMAACEMIKASCEKEPDGAVCKAIIDGYKQK